MNKGKGISFYNTPPQWDVPKPWSMAMRGNKLFFYWKKELKPRYMFTKHTVWVGHETMHRSVEAVIAWVADRRA